jgi:5'-3' exonuclease
MIALIDGDLISYINSASAEGDPEQIALLRADKQIRDILEYTECSEYKIFISGGSNFRKEINPEYKAHRTQEKPIHLEVCNKFLMDEWNATVTEGYEADDALGCEQNKNTIICSLDKDLLMIEGKHYSWPINRRGEIVRDHTIVDVSYIDGIKHFYKQMLIGDTADNIFGVKGIGKVGAAKLINPLETEEDMYRVVFDLYTDLDDMYNTRFMTNADCLWIWRSLGINFSIRNPFG